MRSGTAADRLTAAPSETVITGKLATTVYQHPIVSPDGQFYLDWDSPRGTQQIIVVNRSGQPDPGPGRRIELRGRLEEIDLGGRPGTRDSYRGHVLYMESWCPAN